MTKGKKDNDLQNTIQKTKDRATWTPLKTGGELMLSGKVGSSCSTCGTRRVILVTSKWCIYIMIMNYICVTNVKTNISM